MRSDQMGQDREWVRTSKEVGGETPCCIRPSWSLKKQADGDDDEEEGSFPALTSVMFPIPLLVMEAALAFPAPASPPPHSLRFSVGAYSSPSFPSSPSSITAPGCTQLPWPRWWWANGWVVWSAAVF